jgi:hypothetical protein
VSELENRLETIEKKLSVLVNSNINKNALDKMFDNLNKIASGESRMRASIARLDVVAHSLGQKELYPHLDEALSGAGISKIHDIAKPEWFEILNLEDSEDSALALSVVSPAYIFGQGTEYESIISYGAAEYVISNTNGADLGLEEVSKAHKNIAPIGVTSQNETVDHKCPTLLETLGQNVEDFVEGIFSIAGSTISILKNKLTTENKEK